MNAAEQNVAQTALLAGTVLAAGFFAGLTVASQLALHASNPMTLPSWAVTVDTYRMAAAGTAGIGLLSLLALEWATDSVTQ
jgi:hypothetical protein